MKANNYIISLVLFFSFISTDIIAQKTLVTDSSKTGYRTVIAGPEYKRSKFHQWLWGRNYREEWSTPVQVPVFDIEKEAGGLTPTEQGGGRQTKTLRLEDKNGKEYVLRSINKEYREALPEIARGTFIEKIANDQVSTAHPYAAITIPMMIEAAAVYHTNPKIVFVPYSPRLGKFNETFANMLCLFEERPDDNQQDAPNFGFSKDVEGTEKMFEKVFGDNDHRVDQEAFVRARLFDIFIGDWGRHEDQWRWAKFDQGERKIYKPIPRDRDQVYTLFDGFFLKRITGIEELNRLEGFDKKVKNITRYNFPARNIDRQLTNEVPRKRWLEIAAELQQSITDAIIEKSVGQLPPEVFPISGPEIVEKLKVRRNDLQTYAADYYDFLSREVEVTGSHKEELFEIKKINDTGLQLRVYDLDKNGHPKKTPFYDRIFFAGETKEIRLYGLSGNDRYTIDGVDDAGIKVRIIGGTDHDSVVNHTAGGNIYYYDTRNENQVSGDVKKRFSNDTAINRYVYNSFRYDDGSVVKLPSYSNERGIHLNLGYTYTRQLWRKEPFGWTQKLKGYYSISNNSFGADYEGEFTHVIGKWNMTLDGSYDQKLRNYFFGFGNETKFIEEKLFYSYNTEEINAAIGFNRYLGRVHKVGLTGFYQSVDVRNEAGHLVTNHTPTDDPKVFDGKNFGGGIASYLFHKVNDEVVPTSGINFLASATLTQNLKETDRSVQLYNAVAVIYVPLTKAISIGSRFGGETVNGDPEFYQYPTIGGGRSLRGFQRQRFTGNSVAYNNTDLRWIFNVRSRLFNGKMGLIGFIDHGRVWYDGEDSDTWHRGYGGGILVAPFNKVSFSIYYGMSEETSRFHLMLGRFF